MKTLCGIGGTGGMLKVFLIPFGYALMCQLEWENSSLFDVGNKFMETGL